MAPFGTRLGLSLITTSLLAACAPREELATGSTVQAADWISPQTGMKFVLVPAGSFVMGSPLQEAGRELDEVQYEVILSSPMYLGKYEVTQAEWKAVLGTEPWAGQPLAREAERLPAIYVDWHDAQAFVDRLNLIEGTTAYRLPTEAEWEFAARAGDPGPFPADPLSLGWYADNSGDRRFDAQALWVDDHQTRIARYLEEGVRYRVVGTAAPNRWGLHDMHGNVWEWVADWYAPYPSGTIWNPRGPESGERRAVRSGSWSLPLNYSRSGSRDHDPPSHRAPALGFRVAREIR